MPGRTFLGLWLILCLGGPAGSLPAAEPRSPLLEFRGQVLVPPNVVAVSRRNRITLNLFGVTSPFTARTWADGKGRFRFRNLQPATYTLSLYLPGVGEILQTVEITKSFADPKGRVEKKFSFDAETLRARARPVVPATVSVRELSIPSKARREYEKAVSRLRSRDAERAIEHLKRAVELAPQFVEALNNLGTIYFQKRDLGTAENYFRAALQQEPSAYEPLVNLGGVLLNRGRLREALEINRQAQQTRPHDALANVQLGLSYYLLGDSEQATTYLERTEELDPAHFSNPQIPLAEIYLSRSQEAKALQKLQDFLEQHPDSPRAQRVKAQVERIQQSQATSPEKQVLTPGG